MTTQPITKAQLTKILNNHPVKTRSVDGKKVYYANHIGPLILVSFTNCKIAGEQRGKTRSKQFANIKFSYENEPYHFSVSFDKYLSLQ